MTEDYLHFVWRTQRFFLSNLTTKEGEAVQIIKSGIHNVLNGGPDFNHAAVRMEQVEFYGPVEIHINSSDWYHHKHHLDDAYNNVILHVVFNHDRDVVQNGRKIPVLEIKNLIDWEHYRKFVMFGSNNHEIICRGMLEDTDPIFLKSMMCKALHEKIHHKIRTVLDYVPEREEAMYFFLGSAFGGSQNSYPFLNLLKLVPSYRLRTLSPHKRYCLLLSESGVAEGIDQLGERWHFRGSRPGNFPTKRIHQFAVFLCDEELKLLVKLGRAKEVIATFHELIISQSAEFRLSKTFRDHILINAVVPYLFYLAQVDHDEKFEDLGSEILSLLPAETNRITKKWNDAGVKLTSALDSQGVLALHRYYCSSKKCLSCEVGNSILQR